MKIIKYKKGTKGRYVVSLDDGKELNLYEEVILKYNLLISKTVSDKDLEEIHRSNLEYDVYYVALNSLKHHSRSVYELRENLIKKEYPVEYIDSAIERLKKQGYLDDQMYAKSYINTQMITTNHGPNRIKNDLIQKHISSSIISEELECFDQELQKEKINKIIQNRIKTNHNRGGIVLKNKIQNDLINLGFDSSFISQVLRDYDFHNDPDLAKKEYEKYYKKYHLKYSGYELERKIKEKLYMKGLIYEDES